MAVTLDLAAATPYGDGEGLKGFFLEHRLAHDALAEAIAQQLGGEMPNFDMGDERARAEWELLMLRVEDGPKAPSEALRGWLLVHEALHQAEYGAVGFGELPDLSSVNFASGGEYSDWMFLHQQIHDAVAASLGIA